MIFLSGSIINCSPLFYCIQYNLIPLHANIQSFGVFEAQAHPLSFSCSVLPTKVLLCLPLLSVGLQVGSASGVIVKDRSMGRKGEARVFLPRLSASGGGGGPTAAAAASLWSHSSDIFLLHDLAPSRQSSPWMQLQPNCPSWGLVTSSPSSLSLQRNASPLCCSTPGYFTISCLASQLVTHLCKHVFH